MTKLSGLCRFIIRGLPFFLILAIILEFAPIPLVGQSWSSSFLSRIRAHRANNLNVSFTYSPAFPVEGQAVKFEASATVDSTSLSWDFGDGSSSTEQTPVHTFAKPGFHKVTLVASNGSVSKRTLRTITIMPAPATATFVFSPSSPTVGQTVMFADTSSGDPTSWHWDFGDGATSTAKNPTHVFTRTASYTVTLVSSNSTSSRRGSQTVNVTSSSTLTASFTFSPTSPTAGQTVQFTDTSTGNPTSWNWSFGDGGTSTTRNPSHSFSASGSYNVTLTVTNSNESRSSSRTVVVTPLGDFVASFTYSPASPAAGQTVQFTDTSTGIPTAWHWNFGDGSTSTMRNPSHVFATAGSYNVRLTVTNNSGSVSASRTVTVATALVSSFTYSPASPVVGQTVQFTDTSTGNPTSWNWNFNDGSTSTMRNPSHAFTASGSYTVTLVVSNSTGSSTSTRIINIAPASTLIASFNYSPTSPVPGQPVQFTDTSTGNPTTWQWNFGDGSASTARNPSHTFAATGAYSVTLTVSNSSSSTSVSRTVSVGQESTLFPSDRLIDWSGAGVWHNAGNPARPWEGTKGIPQYPVGITINTTNPGHQYYCDPTGATDSRPNLQAAINACPPGHSVYLPAGTYALSPTLNIRSRVVLRGAGPGLTTLRMLGTGNVRSITLGASGGVSESILMDSGPGPDSSNISGPIVSGYTKGSHTVVVSSSLAANLHAGALVLVNQRNDPNFVTHEGSGGTCTWAAGRGLRAMGEIKMVSAISGTSVTFTRPLYHTYRSELEPKLIRLISSPLVNAGIENLTLDGNRRGGYGGGRLIEVMYAAHCWVRGVEFTDWVTHSIRLFWGALGNEVTGCYMHDVTDFGGDRGYQLNMAGNPTDNYVYDNISKWVHIGVCVGAGGATANVIAYNYNHSTNHWQPWWSIPSYGSHGAHTYMNLFEGNIGTRQAADAYWGSGSHLVLFRNWYSLIMNNDAINRAKIAIELEALNQYTSAIGNVLGHHGMRGNYEIQGPENGVYDTGDGRFFCWKIGFPRSGDQTGPRHQPTIATLIRHGNYDYINNAVADWIEGESRDLPPSLYLDAKPSWFGSLDWPAFGPDVTGIVKTIPAKARWDAYVSSGNLSDLFASY